MMFVTNTISHPRLTIFTPSYNRAHTLPRLFESILANGARSLPVEWLIIDDGSMDETADTVASFAARAPGLIRYEKVVNGGKHRAINHAARMARGNWLMIVDSDDWLHDGALAGVRAAIECAARDRRIGLVRGLRSFDRPDVRHRFPVAPGPARYYDWVRAGPTFDTVEVVRRDVLALHPFPDFPGERFMAEGWLWHRLDRTHQTLYVNEEWVHCQYQAVGLSAQSRQLRARSPRGAMAVYRAALEAPLPWRLKARAAINWWRYRWHAGRTGDPIGLPPASIAWAPVGGALWWRDRRAGAK